VPRLLLSHRQIRPHLQQPHLLPPRLRRPRLRQTTLQNLRNLLPQPQHELSFRPTLRIPARNRFGFHSFFSPFLYFSSKISLPTFAFAFPYSFNASASVATSPQSQPSSFPPSRRPPPSFVFLFPRRSSIPRYDEISRFAYYPPPSLLPLSPFRRPRCVSVTFCSVSLYSWVCLPFRLLLHLFTPLLAHLLTLSSLSLCFSVSSSSFCWRSTLTPFFFVCKDFRLTLSSLPSRRVSLQRAHTLPLQWVTVRIE